MGNVCECIKQNNVLIVNEYKLDIGNNLDRKKKLEISIEKSKGNTKEITKENSKENSTIMINKMNNELKYGNENMFTINDNISVIEPLQNDEISFINNEEINKILFCLIHSQTFPIITLIIIINKLMQSNIKKI
jgi:hypothetical protein